MKIPALFLILCLTLSVAGCSEDNSPPSPPPPTNTLDSVTYTYTALGIQSMRAGEFLALWVKIAPDPTWQFVSVLTFRYRYPNDSVILVGKFYSKDPVDSVNGILLTLERTATPQFPGLLLARGGVLIPDSAKKIFSTSLMAKSELGDYSALQGSLVFTSPLADTTAYKHEFYLMNLQGSQQMPSLLSLNPLPVGWKYGLWAVDTNFNPHQSFLYGLFQSPEGYDSDSANDHYPYPGGWKPQKMDVSGGSIIATLEPDFYGDSMKYKDPSPIVLLEFRRTRNIVKNTNYPMKNVSVQTIPSGTITFEKR